MIGNTGEAEPAREADQRLLDFKRELAGAAHVDIKTFEARGNDDVEWLAELVEELRHGARGGQGLSQTGCEDRAGVQRHDFVASGAHEADGGGDAAQRITVEPRVEGHAPAAFAMGVDQRARLRRNARVVERGHEQPALPVPIGGRGKRLHGATAAVGEMRAKRGDAIRARRDHLDERAAILIDLAEHVLTGERKGDEDEARVRARDALAALAEALDRQAHAQVHVGSPVGPWCADRRAASRNSLLPSPPSMGEGVMAVTSQPSDATKPRMSSQTSAWTRASRTIPFLTRAGPASNCGLMSATRSAPGAASASGTGSTRRSEMKLASQTTRLGACGIRARVSARASVLSMDTTRGSARSEACSWSRPTSTA